MNIWFAVSVTTKVSSGPDWLDLGMAALCIFTMRCLCPLSNWLDFFNQSNPSSTAQHGVLCPLKARSSPEVAVLLLLLAHLLQTCKSFDHLLHKIMCISPDVSCDSIVGPFSLGITSEILWERAGSPLTSIWLLTILPIFWSDTLAFFRAKVPEPTLKLPLHPKSFAVRLRLGLLLVCRFWQMVVITGL